jgi:tartrate-resistant acid phosphatase type 5
MQPTTPQTLKRLVTLLWVINGLTAVCLMVVGLFTYNPQVRAVFVSLIPTVSATLTSTPSQTPSVTPSPSSTPSPTATFTPTFTLTFTPTATPAPLVMAIIGDFGADNSAEADVAALIHGWQPDIIITVGDNNYPSGSVDTIDANIGKYYHDYIYPYTGSYGSGADVNRFFPILGNHDWNTTGVQPYLDYFTLPGNERYYDFTEGPVHFFALDSCLREPDGVKADSVQAAWLQQGLAASTSPWNVVLSHYPSYSSGYHGSTSWIQWPFAAWGADAVLQGHDHLYERLLVDGIPYITNGLGGQTRYLFRPVPLQESQFRYNADHGAMRLTATETEMLFEFYNRLGELIDSYRVTKP